MADGKPYRDAEVDEVNDKSDNVDGGSICQAPLDSHLSSPGTLVESTVYCLDSGLHGLRKLTDYWGCSRAMDTERLRNGERKKKRDVGRLSRMFSADPSAAQVLGTWGTCSLISAPLHLEELQSALSEASSLSL